MTTFKQPHSRDFPGGPVAKNSTLPKQGAQVRSLVRELDPTCIQQVGSPHTVAKTWHSQINTYLKKKKEKKLHSKSTPNLEIRH